MKNKKLSNLINNGKRLVFYIGSTLLNRGDAVVYDRPIHRDIHLNSSAAIRIWLAMTDRPCKQFLVPYIITHGEFNRPLHGDTQSTGGGTSLEESE